MPQACPRWRHPPPEPAAAHPRITKAWADTGYRTKAIDHGARLGIDVHVVRRVPTDKGFKVIPWRSIASGPGWLVHHRRLARAYETHPHRSEAMIHLAIIDLISRRLPENPPRTGATPEPRIKHLPWDETLC